MNEVTLMKNEIDTAMANNNNNFVSTQDILEFKFSDDILNEGENGETKENLFFLEIS